MEEMICKNCFYWEGKESDVFGNCSNGVTRGLIQTSNMRQFLKTHCDFGCIFWKEGEAQ